MVLSEVVHQSPRIPWFLGGTHQSVSGPPQCRDDNDDRLFGFEQDVRDAFQIRTITEA